MLTPGEILAANNINTVNILPQETIREIRTNNNMNSLQSSKNKMEAILNKKIIFEL